MEVEEDPSSQFVDFTNATPLEQFIADIEQTLIVWQLSNKGHACADALGAAFPQQKQQQQRARRRSSVDLTGDSYAADSSTWREDEPLTWTHVVELDLHGNGAPNCYALTLFVSNQSSQPHEQHKEGDSHQNSMDTNNNSSKKNQWQEGLEHFTPTMLAIADSTRDFHWQRGCNGAATGFHDSSVFVDGNDGLTLEDEQKSNKRATFESVKKWFGVDEFVFLSRTSQSANRRPVSTMNRSRPLATSNSEASDTNQALSGEDVILGNKSGVSLRAGEDDERKDFMLDIAVDQNESGVLLSALTIALNNCNCTLPAFVPTYAPSNGTWLGSAVPGATGNVSISFETDSIPEVNSHQSCISGLLDFFRLKLQLPHQIEEKYRLAAASGDSATDLALGMSVSASFGYSWTRADDPREMELDHSTWKTQCFNEGAGTFARHQNDHAEHQQVVKALFGGDRSDQCVGSVASPLLGMDLTVIWPNLREGTYVDNVVHSSLDAKKAPEWMLDVRFQDLKSENERKPQLALSKVVANLVQAYSNSRELSKDILVSEMAPNLPPSATQPPSSSSSSTTSAPSSSSSRLPETIPAARAAVVIGNAIGTLTSTLVSAATWKGTDIEEIRRIVWELFDDVDDGSAHQKCAMRSTLPMNVAHSAPIGQLVSILACRMGQLHGVNAMSLLWVEFVKMLRERWFQLRLLPAMIARCAVLTGFRVAAASVAGFPPVSTAPEAPITELLHFKVPKSLQKADQDFSYSLFCWLFVCRQAEICRTPAETNDLATTMSDLTSFTLDYDEDNDVNEEAVDDSPGSDDEFFDSIEQHDTQHSGSTAVAGSAATGVTEGGRRVIPGVYCLTTNALMMEPLTQVAVPMTEDVAKEQQDLLSRLGVSVESAMLRQQIQSAALVSDMQAFKAANPGCCLADFIRWYSPKDWIPVDPLQSEQEFLPEEGRNVWWFEKQGMLSERMRFGSKTQQKHLWQQIWETSAPVPASRQKCLFDPLHESEKIYHYLETISPHELFHQMLAGVIASACYTLTTALPFPSKELPVFDAAMRDLVNRCNRAIALLDDALAESQVAFPAGKDQREEHEKAKGQLQVAFEMALDACWKLVLELEHVESLLSNALALLECFLPSPSSEDERKPHDAATTSATLELINLLLLQTATGYHLSGDTKRYASTAMVPGGRSISELLQVDALRERVTTLVLLNPVLIGPVQREYVLRCISPRPFLREYYLDDDPVVDQSSSPRVVESSSNGVEESPLVVNRMYAAFEKNTVRFALVLAESEF
ncbi:Rab3 gtpase-activating protein catalytic subunit, partial [Globisporangium splendens]